MTSGNKSRSAKKPQPRVQTESGSSELIRQVADLPDEEKLEVYAHLEVSRIGTTFSGPLPHPYDFKKYADILPNAPDRIMAMAENEQKIRSWLRLNFFACPGPVSLGRISKNTRPSFQIEPRPSFFPPLSGGARSI